jgi:phosphatidylglycerophosphate synthase
MAHPPRHLIIDARPRGQRGPLANEVVMGRPILVHLLELAAGLTEDIVIVHARADEHSLLLSLLGDWPSTSCALVTGPPPEGSTILRTDRFYDRARLVRAVRRRRDPESAVLWRLDTPALLAGAEDELRRRQSYQPLGRFWALGPARWLARRVRGTRIRPNHVTAVSAALVLGASALVAWSPPTLASRALMASALALALIFDTADGHLARLQGTASTFGRWLDANLDELGDLALHTAIAWAAFRRAANPAWLLLAILYVSGKYLLMVGHTTWHEEQRGPSSPSGLPSGCRLRTIVRALGHADLRWHVWIFLAALGRLEWDLVAYAVYYPARAMAGASRKGGRRG